jgi:hypothetical protein
MKSGGFMKIAAILLFLICAQRANAACYGPQLARNAVRAIATVSGHAEISDLVGACTDSTCQIAANYRSYGFADIYSVIYNEPQCRIIELKLTAINQPVQNPR